MYGLIFLHHFGTESVKLVQVVKDGCCYYFKLFPFLVTEYDVQLCHKQN